MIDDVNDNSPVIAPGVTFTVSESSSNGSLVGTISATDIDLVGSLSNWSIFGGNTGNAFSINPNSGQINLLNALDFETTSSYTLSLTV